MSIFFIRPVKEPTSVEGKGSLPDKAKDLTIIFTILWRRQWHPTPVLLPGKSHGQRSLVGCSPWGHEESDTTERLHFHFLFSCIGEGKGNPFQCSCLENPRDGGTSWAAVYGVAQSRTRLKRLSSSSCTCISSVQSLSCVRLCYPIDGSPPGFPVPGILQARTLEWVAISFSNA